MCFIDKISSTVKPGPDFISMQYKFLPKDGATSQFNLYLTKACF